MKFKLLTGLLIAPVVVPLGINFSNHSSQKQSVYLNNKKSTNIVVWGISDGYIYPINRSDVGESVTIPDHVAETAVTGIRDSAFYRCTSLETVIVPDSVKIIGNASFSGCTSLANINIPSSVTSIGQSSFYNCSALTDIVLPNSVKSIGKSAFALCTGLTNINIPGSVTSIGDVAFAQCSSLSNIVLNWSNVNDISLTFFSFTIGSPKNINIEIHQDIEQADKDSINALKNQYREKLTNNGLTNPATFKTWFDSSTPSPPTALNVFNLDTRIQTSISNGFKAWKDEKSESRSVTLEYTTSDNSINATGIINNDLSTIITRITSNVNIPNINAKDVTFTPRLHLRDSSNNFDKTVDLESGTIRLEANTNHSINKNHLNKSTEISNNREGLWINGDTYDTRIVVNKAYFGQNWNNPNYIKNNFNEYINVSGNNQTYQFNHTNNTNIYTNPKIGQMTVTGVDQDTDPNSYLIKLWFSVPNSVDYQLLNQTVAFDLKNAPSGSGYLFTINTCDKNQFDPNYNNFRANNLNLTSGERSGTIVWNDSDQTQFKNLGNTNTCKWAISKGYTLSLTNFTNDYISIDSNPRFDVNSNTLQVGVTQTKPVPQQTSVNVSGLKLKIVNGTTIIRQDITLPSLTVTLGASSTDITTTNLTYTGADQKSLRDKGDTASFDLTIPEILKPQSDDQLINKFNFTYKGEGESTWTWKPVPSETGVYKFQYHHEDETYTLTYQLVTNLQSDINPRYTYHITLTQEFDGKVKKDIEFSFIGASSSNPFEINADEFVPPSNNILGPVLGGVFGSIAAIGLATGGFVFYKKRHNTK